MTIVASFSFCTQLFSYLHACISNTSNKVNNLTKNANPSTINVYNLNMRPSKLKLLTIERLIGFALLNIMLQLHLWLFSHSIEIVRSIHGNLYCLWGIIPYKSCTIGACVDQHSCKDTKQSNIINEWGSFREIHYAFPCIVDEWMGGTRFRVWSAMNTTSLLGMCVILLMNNTLALMNLSNDENAKGSS
jgi:hypothetical protein